jgi:hypothetical protein
VGWRHFDKTNGEAIKAIDEETSARFTGNLGPIGVFC